MHELTGMIRTMVLRAAPICSNINVKIKFSIESSPVIKRGFTSTTEAEKIVDLLSRRPP